MTDQPTTSAADARDALRIVRDRRLRVIAEIGLPFWYWAFLAAGWIALGVISDRGVAWVTSAATLLFGAVHSTIAPRVLDGRRRSARLSVSAGLAARDTARIVVAGLVGLVLVTIGLTFAASADGAGDPTTVASVFVAVLILLGGPQLSVIVRRRAAAAA